MDINWALVVDIAAPVLALFVGVAVDRLFERKPKLLSYLSQVSSFTIKGTSGNTVVNTHSIVVTNAGRKPATNVRIGHNVLPDFQILPSVQCSITPTPSGGNEILIPTLVPREQITISYLYFAPVLWSMVNSYVKSDEGMATIITVLPTRQYPNWLLQVLRVLVIVGAVAIIYAVIIGVRALVRAAV